ncbi:MAG: hypothetical protein NTY46_02450 [Candidatus Sumerlaeota bacterium]|nr:hypothetical protein [Candidatus Sumerlaeota bacterium]
MMIKSRIAYVAAFMAGMLSLYGCGNRESGETDARKTATLTTPKKTTVIRKDRKRATTPARSVMVGFRELAGETTSVTDLATASAAIARGATTTVELNISSSVAREEALKCVSVAFQRIDSIDLILQDRAQPELLEEVRNDIRRLQQFATQIEQLDGYAQGQLDEVAGETVKLTYNLATGGSLDSQGHVIVDLKEHLKSIEAMLKEASGGRQ